MTLDPSIRRPTFLRPSKGGAHVRAFCRQVAPGQDTVTVKSIPAAGARPSMCFHNVRHVCDARGGEAEYGWLIWEWVDTYIEAEHHAVWCHDGARIDVTPRTPHFAEVTFLPDPERLFDFSGRRRIDNVRKALRNDAAVREYLALAAEAVAIEEANTVGNEVVLDAEKAFAFDRVAWRKQLIEGELVQWSMMRHGRNEACWCGSGRKHKHCCIPGQRAGSKTLLTA